MFPAGNNRRRPGKLTRTGHLKSVSRTPKPGENGNACNHAGAIVYLPYGGIICHVVPRGAGQKAGQPVACRSCCRTEARVCSRNRHRERGCRGESVHQSSQQRGWTHLIGARSGAGSGDIATAYNPTS